MKKLNLLIASLLLFFAPLALAQNSESTNSSEATELPKALDDAFKEMTPEQRAEAEEQLREAQGACAACGGGLILVTILLIVLNIALLVWVARDAKNRGMDNAILWMLLVFFLSLLGFLIYILSRPKGDLVVCSSCQGKRLSVSAICPHCQNP